MMKFEQARGASQAGGKSLPFGTSTPQSKGQSKEPLVGTSRRVASLMTAWRAAKKRAASQLYKHTNGRLVSEARACHQSGGPGTKRRS